MPFGPICGHAIAACEVQERDGERPSPTCIGKRAALPKETVSLFNAFVPASLFMNLHVGARGGSLQIK